MLEGGEIVWEGGGDSVGGRRENGGNEMISGKRPTDRSKRGE